MGEMRRDETLGWEMEIRDGVRYPRVGEGRGCTSEIVETGGDQAR